MSPETTTIINPMPSAARMAKRTGNIPLCRQTAATASATIATTPNIKRRIKRRYRIHCAISVTGSDGLSGGGMAQIHARM